ncbi:GNAT family N-acetyltransferase [Enterococcus sp. AZ109]|uniref:GNAT family N-acetyltransferase n=1 Tax=Enterococcus sp. AZ109 TaxID=2774634 RepID=UPI003F284F61
MGCFLREWKLEDAGELATLLDNQKIQVNLRDGLPYPYRKKDAEEFILHSLLTNRKFSLAIVSEHMVIGSIGVFRQENIHFRTAEIGYYIGEAYWGKGLGTEALKQMCQLVFETTDIVRIFAEPFSDNIASCRILEKAGFQLEGTLRKSAYKKGLFKDQQMYSFIKE